MGACRVCLSVSRTSTSGVLCVKQRHRELFSFLGSSDDLKEGEVGVGGMLPLRLCLVEAEQDGKAAAAQ